MLKKIKKRSLSFRAVLLALLGAVLLFFITQRSALAKMYSPDPLRLSPIVLAQVRNPSGSRWVIKECPATDAASIRHCGPDEGQNTCQDAVEGCSGVPIDTARGCADTVGIQNPFLVRRLLSGRYFTGYTANDVVALNVAINGDFAEERFELKYLEGVIKKARRETLHAAKRVLSRYGVANSADVLRSAGDGDGVTFVDIGMNMGAYGLQMWSMNVSVIGVEAMPSNQRLLELSQCINERELRGLSPFKLLPVGLTNPTSLNSNCTVISHPTNIGDGILVCSEEVVQDSIKRGYVTRGTVQLTTADNAIMSLLKAQTNALHDSVLLAIEGAKAVEVADETPFPQCSGMIAPNASTQALLQYLRKPKVIVKIDVEGHELRVWEGGMKLLAELTPVCILSEIWPELSGVKYVELMASFGYVTYVNLRDGKTRDTWTLIDGPALAQLQKETKRLYNLVFVRPGTLLME